MNEPVWRIRGGDYPVLDVVREQVIVIDIGDRPKPYYRAIGPELHLGYRKGKMSTGGSLVSIQGMAHIGSRRLPPQMTCSTPTATRS